MIKNGRGYQNSRRCDFCRDLGSYLDTGMCELCEDDFAKKTASLRGRLERAEVALKRIADYVSTVRSGDAGEMARIAREALGAEAGEAQAISPV